ncbi:MAG: hypothetical protein KGR98_02625 [Verrucomicrobia bacterium]|nr:hypothetical protein [Verrucomicrobiota bacterium]MDE3099181.1 hypothetical protein [Verrucomicrobiota bacterium]
MRTLEKVTGTFVRHNWKEIVNGVSRGKSYLVENHGRTEAVVVPPDAALSAALDLEEYFKELKKQPAIKLRRINDSLRRAPEL